MTLKERRIAAGLNMPQLAKLAGTKKQQIDKLESGERQFSVKWAKRLAPHLGISWQALLEEQTGPSPSPATGHPANEPPKDSDDLAIVARAWPELDASARRNVIVLTLRQLNAIRMERANLVPTPKLDNDPAA